MARIYTKNNFFTTAYGTPMGGTSIYEGGGVQTQKKPIYLSRVVIQKRTGILAV